MIPTQPPANKKQAVNSKKGVSTIVEQILVTVVKIVVVPPDRVVNKLVRVETVSTITPFKKSHISMQSPEPVSDTAQEPQGQGTRKNPYRKIEIKKVSNTLEHSRGNSNNIAWHITYPLPTSRQPK